MYEERRNKFSLRDIVLTILLIVLFVFIMVWLFPTKNYLEENKSSELYTNYLVSMENAAKDYFTKNRMPSNIGDSVKLTLSEMLEKKMVLHIGGNVECDLEKSYIEVTKMDTDFQLRVELSCTEFSDYKMVTLGCKDYCDFGCQDTPSDNSNNNTTPQSTKKYTVTFDSNGGSAVSSQKIVSGKKAVKPANPTKDGYTFVEWKLNGKTYDFNKAVTGNITLVASWEKVKYTVTFDSNGGSAVSSQTVVSGAKAVKPTNPTKDGYTFVEWKLNGKTYDFNKAVTGNITLVASWKENILVEYQYTKKHTSFYTYYTDWSSWSSTQTYWGVYKAADYQDTDTIQYQIIEQGSADIGNTSTACNTETKTIQYVADKKKANTVKTKKYDSSAVEVSETIVYGGWTYSGEKVSNIPLSTSVSDDATVKYIWKGFTTIPCDDCSTSNAYVYYVQTRTATTKTKYSCASGYIEEGSGSSLKCYKEVSFKSCSSYGSDYLLDGNNCVKYATKEVEETNCFEIPVKNVYVKYQYRTRSLETGYDYNYSYKYSTSNADTSLTSIGYRLTGKVCTTKNGVRTCK